MSGGRPPGSGTWPSKHPLLRALVLDRIATGALKPGDVASIAVLGPEAGVGRDAASRAMAGLVADGVLERRRGVGYVVTDAARPRDR